MGADLLLPRRLLTVDEYHRMAEVGVFEPDERIELLDGDLVTMSPNGWKHAQLVNELSTSLILALNRTAIVAVQNPVVLGSRSEPQPDVAVLRPEANRTRATPTAADVILLIEVADTTIARDRDVKVPIYARHGIPEVWLVDAEREEVRV